jgi:F420-non-reducing hydrogenase iron-sulfur subunit
VRLPGADDEADVAAQLDLLLPDAGAAAHFEPRIVAFVCNWCAYAGADKAGASQTPYSENLRLVRIMCTGRMDPQLALMAYDEGADGVLVLGCHPGDCHYKEQNLRMLLRHRLFLRLLRQVGIEEERCRLDFVSAAEGERFARVATEMVETIRRLGPMRRTGGGPSPHIGVSR